MDIIEWSGKFDKNEIGKLKNMDKDFTFVENVDKLFILYLGDKIYGYAVIGLEKVVELKKIFIIPRLRNNGYGTILLKYVINWLINNNYDSLIVVNHKQMNNFLEEQRFVKNEEGYILNNLTQNKKQEKRMLFVSKFAIGINVILAFLKIISGTVFKSTSLLADGINSLSDLITNILVIIGLKVGANPEDKDHPFGHGKIESVFSVIIGTFIILTAFDLIRENMGNLISPENKMIFGFVPVIVTIVAIIIKIFQLMFMKYKTRDYRSQLINSLLKDYKSDIVISSAVLLGIMLSKFNPLFDTFVGMGVAIYIIREGYKLIKENALILLDSQDEKLLESIKKDIFDFEEIENAHDFRMTTSGKDIYIFADIRVNKEMSVHEAHEITNKISKFVRHKYINVKKVLIHLEPVYESE
ncbi:GNAT family N-acetyltransferase [Pseudoleptotrichia goodfellowii]|uniref:Cation diffusion facilitator family transporter n=1 Tax=Pseudoleptotrichia goodfellowii F0264 TaxID=596323 RepID=D0GKJ2_9FUSO|nr:GNAT family N-acetyltransferase [Pseudoleptotrichia goodfellowii]EEY35406.1 cation diffusion facilitator family transporter [Pseudoleptotrichia goodfellowii F0264]